MRDAFALRYTSANLIWPLWGSNLYPKVPETVYPEAQETSEQMQMREDDSHQGNAFDGGFLRLQPPVISGLYFSF